MTVCVACIATYQGFPVIVGASDRMVTAGDLEFEPPHSKIYTFNDAVAAVFAGDVTDHQTIFRESQRRAASERVTDAKGIAEIYADVLATLRRRRTEIRVLTPLGLTTETFISRQQEMSERFVDEIFQRLEADEAVIEVGALIVGIDQDRGPSILEVRDPGIVTDFSLRGYAAVGSGASHSLSKFRFDQYSTYWPLAQAMLLAYRAKQFAQAAPGVGLATDLFSILPERGFQLVDSHTEAMVRQAYLDGVRGEQQAWFDAYTGIHAKIDAAVSEAKEQAEGKQANQLLSI